MDVDAQTLNGLLLLASGSVTETTAGSGRQESNWTKERGARRVFGLSAGWEFDDERWINVVAMWLRDDF
jgi:hypothetical protein